MKEISLVAARVFVQGIEQPVGVVRNGSAYLVTDEGLPLPKGTAVTFTGSFEFVPVRCRAKWRGKVFNFRWP